jgi:hypothetical protein
VFCPHCATENTAPSNSCISCGKSLTAWTGFVVPQAAPVQGTGPGLALPPAEPPKMSILAALGMMAIILFAMIAAFTGLAEGDSAEKVGYRIGTLIGLLALPGAIAYAIAGRKAVRNLNQFALWFCVVGVFAIGGHFTSSRYLQTETPDQRVGRLMREAAGAQPVRQIGSSRDRQLDTLLRGHFQKLLQLNKDYTEVFDKLDIRDGLKLNSPESFMSPTLAARGLGQFHAAYDLDLQQEDKVKNLLDNMRQTIAGIDISASERRELFQGFDKGLSQQMEKRQRVIAAEKAWIQALDYEYAYVGAHRRDFVIQMGHLAIRNEAVRQEFNARVHAQNADRKEFLRIQQDFSQSQAGTMRGFGLTPNGTAFK